MLFGLDHFIVSFFFFFSLFRPVPQNHPVCLSLRPGTSKEKKKVKEGKKRYKVEWRMANGVFVFLYKFVARLSWGMRSVF